MITISIEPIIFGIGHFALRWYGVIIAVALVVGVWLAAKEAERKGFNKNDIYDATMWVALAGLLGARLFYVIDHWPEQFGTNPITALYIWQGGLVIWGAIIGGLLAIVILAQRKRWPLLRLLDAFVPGLALALAIGRVACIITGDTVGPPTSGPFGLAYTNPGAMVSQLGVYYTPMPAYELVGNLLIFALVWQFRKRKLSDGALFVIYLTLYSLERFLLGYTSAFKTVIFGFNQSQLISLAVLTAIVLFFAGRSLLKFRALGTK
ncbi:MAG: prolipoprotein diacylglyceryl transferase [Anaerolineales bacterium]